MECEENTWIFSPQVRGGSPLLRRNRFSLLLLFPCPMHQVLDESSKVWRICDTMWWSQWHVHTHTHTHSLVMYVTERKMFASTYVQRCGCALINSLQKMFACGSLPKKYCNEHARTSDSSWKLKKKRKRKLFEKKKWGALERTMRSGVNHLSVNRFWFDSGVFYFCFLLLLLLLLLLFFAGWCLPTQQCSWNCFFSLCLFVLFVFFSRHLVAQRWKKKPRGGGERKGREGNNQK